MILKSYFDGGNQADSKQYDVLTLAAVSGTHDEWVPFEKDWRKTLKKHGAKWLHTTDAISLADPFSRREGWSEAKRDALLMDCVRVAGRHIARQNRPNEPGRYGLYPFTVKVVLKDFIEARKVSPEVPTTATEACALCRHFMRVWNGEGKTRRQNGIICFSIRENPTTATLLIESETQRF